MQAFKFLITIIIFVGLGLIKGPFTSIEPNKIQADYKEYYNEISNREGGLTPEEMNELERRGNEFLNSFEESQITTASNAYLIFSLAVLVVSFLISFKLFRATRMSEVTYISGICLFSLSAFSYGIELAIYTGLAFAGGVMGLKYNKRLWRQHP